MNWFFRAQMACWLAGISFANGGTLVGHLRDPNWYAQHTNTIYGVGYYEYGINANPTNSTAVGGAAATGIFGEFQMGNVPSGYYTVASWDVWWRSSHAFNFYVPSGSSADLS